MIEREAIMAELWRRMTLVSSGIYTTRNTKVALKLENLPAIQLFEGPDTVVEKSSRGGHPIYKRVLNVQIELCINATSEGAASKEIGEFLDDCKKQLYVGGTTLDRKCAEFSEVEIGAIVRPPIGENAIAVGFEIEVLYIEEVSKLF